MKPGPSRSLAGTQDIRGFLGSGEVRGKGKGKERAGTSGEVRGKGKGKERAGTSGGARKKGGMESDDEIEERATTRDMGHFPLSRYSDFVEFLTGIEGGGRNRRRTAGESQ